MIVAICSRCGRQFRRSGFDECPACFYPDEPADVAAECERLARLYASAGDLLAACEDMLRRFGFTDWVSVHDAAVIDAARAAVAKARGETP